MQFKARIISVGELPPASGEPRREYLYHYGAKWFNAAGDLLEQVYNRLTEGEFGASVDVPRAHSLVYEASSINPEVLASAYRSAYESCRSSIDSWLQEDVGGSRSAFLDTIEQDVSRALQLAIDAYNYLEDVPDAEPMAHRLVHDAGSLKGGLFGCFVEKDADGVYWETCPVTLMHRRYGFSAGIRHSVECSVCRGDLEMCAHWVGESYTVEVQRSTDGSCSVCGELACIHAVGSSVSVIARERFVNPVMREVTMTPRPRDPLARFTAIELDREALEQGLGVTLSGQVIRCLGCSGPCAGFVSDAHHEIGGQGVLGEASSD